MFLLGNCKFILVLTGASQDSSLSLSCCQVLHAPWALLPNPDFPVVASPNRPCARVLETCCWCRSTTCSTTSSVVGQWDKSVWAEASLAWACGEWGEAGPLAAGSDHLEGGLWAKVGLRKQGQKQLSIWAGQTRAEVTEVFLLSITSILPVTATHRCVVLSQYPFRGRLLTEESNVITLIFS
jgi:hypothetical protein